MAEARQLKSREYYTNVIAHDTSITNLNNQAHRNTNTFRSEALMQDPRHNKVLNSRTHEKIFGSKELASNVTRASYQDSNPLLKDRVENKTIQQNMLSPPQNQATRDTNTWKSGVFNGAAGTGGRQRDQDTFKSTVFGSATPNPVNRKKLGGESKGVDTLFGRDKSNYDLTSNNQQISTPQNPKLANEAIIPTKTQVEREFHGETVHTQGMNHETKHDGCLMAQNIDWKNPSVKAIQGKEVDNSGMDSKDRKHQNLQSSIFGGGYVEQEPVVVDRAQARITYGTTADWKTQAALQHPENHADKAVAYKYRQDELTSKNVNLEQTDYDHHVPITKAEAKNIEGQQQTTDAPIAKGLKTAKDFKEGVRGMESHVDDYDAKERASNMLQGMYQQKYASRPKSANITPVLRSKVNGRETKAVKQAMLASNHFETGQSSLEPVFQSDPQVVDLSVSRLPADFNTEKLKNISGSKHVFEVSVEQDNMKGICSGNGRIKIRLNHGETSEKVKLNFLREGIIVHDHNQDPRKRPVVTGIPREKSKEITNHHYEKQSFLQTQQPEMFGTTQRYLPIWR